MSRLEPHGGCMRSSPWRKPRHWSGMQRIWPQAVEYWRHADPQWARQSWAPALSPRMFSSCWRAKCRRKIQGGSLSVRRESARGCLRSSQEPARQGASWPLHLTWNAPNKKRGHMLWDQRASKPPTKQVVSTWLLALHPLMCLPSNSCRGCWRFPEFQVSGTAVLTK